MKSKKPIVKKLIVGGMQANCYIFADPKTKDAFIIDPGGEPQKIKDLIEKGDFKIRSIINTHGHIDHISANKHFDLPIWIHEDDASFLEDSQKNLSSLVGFDLKSPAAARFLAEGDVLEVGSLRLEVIHTPGHTPGSICLKYDGIMFTGDLLFSGGIGRSDFPYGSE